MYQNWTDAIPVCTLTDVGTENKFSYKSNSHSASEDRHFRLACPNNCFLYGVFDGHDGARVANFAQQKLPAELILGQLKDDHDDGNVREKLNDAFESVAKEFVDGLINKSLMQKMSLMELVPKGMSKVEVQQRYVTLYEELEQCDREIAGSCTAVVALIHQNRLFIANVGDARAVLCRQDDATGELGIIQLSIDHTTSTESELQRLMRLGLEDKLEELQTCDVIRTTRSIGDWVLKNEYKDIEILRDAKEEPIISKPSIHGGELLTASMKFLVMMSRGLYSTYKEATGVNSKQVNNEIVHLVAQELYRTNGNVRGVAQKVVNQICNLHRDAFKKHGRYSTRSDMTLLIRVFNIEDEPKLIEKAKPSELTKKNIDKPRFTPIIIPKRNPEPSSPNSTGSNTPTTVTPGTPGSSGSVSPSTNPFTRNVTTDERPITSQMEDLNIYQKVDDLIPVRRPLFEIPNNSTNFMEPLRVETGDIYELPHELDVLNVIPDENNSQMISRDGEQSVNSQNNSNTEDKTLLFNRPPEPLEMDEDGRIKPYVDFSEFFQNVNMKGGEREVFREFLS